MNSIGRMAWGTLGLVVLSLVTHQAMAASATWTATANGTVEYWTNTANWSASPYPGSGTTETGLLNTAVAGAVYKSVLNTVLPNPLAQLTIQNTGAGGEAWLIVTNGSMLNTTITMGSNGRLQIDGAGSVTNIGYGNAYFDGKSDGRIYVNAGGLLAGPNLTLARSASGSGHLMVIDGGTVAVLTNFAVSYGSDSNTVIVRGGGRLTAGNMVGTVTASGSDYSRIFVDNGQIVCAIMEVGRSTSSRFSSLSITNNGRVSSTSGYVGGAYQGSGSGSAANCLALIASGGLWDLGGGSLMIGRYTGGTGNVVRVDAGGVLSNAVVSIGASAAGAWANQLTITNSGKFYGAGALSVSAVAGSSNNVLEVVGGEATSTVINSGTIVLGNGFGGNNSMTASKALIRSVGLTIGNAGSSNNVVTVRNDVLWDMGGGALTWGQGGTGNVFSFVSDTSLTNIGGVNLGDIGTSLTLANWNLSSGGALNVGTSAGLGGNTLTLTNQSYTAGALSTVGNGSASNALYLQGNCMWNAGAQGVTVGSGGGVGNVLSVRGGSMITNVGSAGVVVGAASSSGNTLSLDGTRVYVSGGKSWVGAANASSNTVLLQNGAFWDNRAYGWAIASGSNSVGNTLTMSGSVMSNGAAVTLGQAAARNFGNSLVFSNGSTYLGKGVTLDGSNNTLQVGGAGLASYALFSTTFSMDGDSGRMTLTNAFLYCHTTPAGFNIGNGSSNNTCEVDAGGAADIAKTYVGLGSGSFNTFLVNGGAVTQAVTATYVGAGTSANLTNAIGNRLIITNGGRYCVTSLLQLGAVAGDSNNTVTVTTGGLLGDAGNASSMVWTNNGGAGNFITNNGGIFEFAHALSSVTIVPTVPGSIAMTDGTLSFANLSNVNVKANWSGSSLTNIAFNGTRNVFRLNNASATNSYWFDSITGAATNYAGLEMVYGTTAYTNGSVTTGTNGWLTFSNTTATLWGAVTNYGTLRIIDSTVTFKNRLTLGEGCKVTWASNSAPTAVTVNGVLGLPTSAELTLPGGVGPNDALVLFQAPGGISGTPSNWQVIGQPGARVALGGGGTQVVVRQTATGFIFKVL